MRASKGLKLASKAHKMLKAMNFRSTMSLWSSKISLQGPEVNFHITLNVQSVEILTFITIESINFWKGSDARTWQGFYTSPSQDDDCGGGRGGVVDKLIEEKSPLHDYRPQVDDIPNSVTLSLSQHPTFLYYTTNSFLTVLHLFPLIYSQLFALTTVPTLSFTVLPALSFTIQPTLFP